jgi:hypothetical protein
MSEKGLRTFPARRVDVSTCYNLPRASKHYIVQDWLTGDLRLSDDLAQTVFLVPKTGLRGHA